MHTAARPEQPIRLYRFRYSGHSHRAELFLSLLGLPYEPVDVDLVRGEHRQPDFLERNPFGQVPVIEDGALTLADSNAILVYLARRYDATGRWLPADPVLEAQVQRWFSVAAGPLVNGPGNARVARLFGRPHDPRTQETAQRLFGVMEQHLGEREVLVGTHHTLADLAMYTYTAHAPEGDIPLDPYPCIRRWLQGIEALPGFVPMPRPSARAGR